MNYRTGIGAACVLLCLALVTGCTGGGILSPDVNRNAKYHSPDYRVVMSGETLYSISWDAGVDFRTLARWNHIGPPYLLRAGQLLRIAAPGSGGSANAAKQNSPFYVVARGDTVYHIAHEHGVSVRQVVRWNGLGKSYRIHPGQRLRVAPVRSTSPPPVSQANPVYSLQHGRVRRVGAWVWPAQGVIVGRFRRNGLNKGIDIAGVRGSPVVAAAGGRVVYQGRGSPGSGLRAYGKLIIIEHNPDFLSAYAHCARILVKENAQVKRGQEIATMGRSGTDRVMLHFEIRLRGKPVNPLRYLPKKS